MVRFDCFLSTHFIEMVRELEGGAALAGCMIRYDVLINEHDKDAEDYDETND